MSDLDHKTLYAKLPKIVCYYDSASGIYKAAQKNWSTTWNYTQYNKNLAIKTGRVSKDCELSLIIVDLDCKPNSPSGIEFLKHYQSTMTCFPKTITARSKSGGMHYWFSSKTPIKVKHFKDVGVDILGDGAYCICPPTACDAENRSYSYDFIDINADFLDEYMQINVEALPEIPEDFLKMLGMYDHSQKPKLGSVRGETIAIKNLECSYTDEEMARIKMFCMAIKDDGNAKWVAVCRALCGYCITSGYAPKVVMQMKSLWFQWSMTSYHNYKDASDEQTEKIWSYWIDKTKETPISTIYKMALDDGFVEPMSESMVIVNTKKAICVQNDQHMSIQNEHKEITGHTSFISLEKSRVHDQDDDDFAIDYIKKLSEIPYPPGYVGVLARAIEEGAFHKKRQFAINAALQLASISKAGGFTFKDKLCLSMYCLNVGPSSSGKDDYTSIVKDVLDTKLKSRYLSESSQSMQAIMEEFVKMNHRAMVAKEFKKFYNEFSKNDAKKAFITNMLDADGSETKFWSEMNARTAGKTIPRIDYPKLNFFGECTDDEINTFYNDREIRLGGLFSRFYIVLGSWNPLEYGEHESHFNMPKDVEKWLKSNSDIGFVPAQQNGTSVTFNSTVRTQVRVRPDKEAHEVFRQYCSTCNDNMKAMMGTDDFVVFGRSLSKAEKVAAVICDFDTIGREHAEWAVSWIEALNDCIKYEINQGGKGVKSQYSTLRELILKVISKRGKPTSIRDLTNNARSGIREHKLDEIRTALNNMCANNDLEFIDGKYVYVKSTHR